MDFINEGTALGIGLIMLGCCVKQYIEVKKDLHCLKAAHELPMDRFLKSHIESLPGKKLPYAMIRGTVKPIGLPLSSILLPEESGVLKVMKVRKPGIFQSPSFWIENQYVNYFNPNETAFKLQGSGDAIEIFNPFSASFIDSDFIKMDFAGSRLIDYQITEKMLRTGSVITAIGELKLDGDALRLQPSFLLSSCTKDTLIQRFEYAKSSSRMSVIIFSLVATFLVGLIVRKFYMRRKKQREERQMQELLEKERRTRRELTRSEDLNIEQLCVVCFENPKEIIILPCGYVCLCEECAARIQANCPVCRGKILNKTAAFI